jgi:hypothetical protein
MKKRNRIIAGITVAALLVLGACSTATQDRTDGAGGTEPDYLADAKHVTLVRNADNVPNVALFCAEGFGFAATLSADGTRSPQLVRMPELDKTCPPPNATVNPKKAG